MSIVDDDHALELSRRALMRRAGGIAGGCALVAAGLAACPAAAATRKLSQAASAYQDKPKGKQRCDNCVQWQPPAACKIVEGVISPAGWCNLYAPAR